MTEKILVAYASRTGATKEIAEAIGKSLADGGADVDIRSMTEIKISLPTVRWCRQRDTRLEMAAGGDGVYAPAPADLKKKPFAAFMVCITLAMKNGENYRQGIRDWMSSVRSWCARSARATLLAGWIFPKCLFHLTH